MPTTVISVTADSAYIPARRRWAAPVAAILLLAAVTLATYWPTFHNGFIWDDDRYIESNIELLNLPGLGHIWTNHGTDQYYPLTYSTFWLEYQLFRANPFVYHLDNLILHVGVALMLWRILRRLRIPGAYVAALIFAVHPVQVESVAWATERKNVLSALLYLLSLVAYLRTPWGRQVTDDAAPSSRPWLWYALSLLLFFAALLSKTVTSTLPAAILLLVWWRRGRIRLRDVVPLLPMFAAGVAMGSLTRWIEQHHVGAVGPIYSFTPIERLCIAGRALWFYLYKLVLPHPLAFIYPRWHSELDHRAWLALFPLSAAVVLVALGSLRHRLGRGPITVALFYVGTLIPALGFFNVYPMRYSFVADHFQYLAAIAPIVIANAAIARYFNRSVAVSFAVVAIAACHFLAYHQCNIYRDRLTLWRDTLTKNPDSPMVHINYGQELFAAHNLAGADAEFRQAVRLAPDSPAPYLCMGTLASAYKDWPTAIRCYTRALELMPDSAERVLHNLRADPYYHLGLAYAALANRTAAAGDPSNAARYRQAAIDNFQTAITIIPNYELAMLSLGQLYNSEHNFDQAVAQFRQAKTANPDSLSAREGLGNALCAQGRLDDALAEYREMLGIEPGNAVALNNIGAIFIIQGRLRDAVYCFQSALQSRPNFEDARKNLQKALALQKAGGH
jgi:protein O-mannosyl-transferase